MGVEKTQSKIKQQNTKTITTIQIGIRLYWFGRVWKIAYELIK